VNAPRKVVVALDAARHSPGMLDAAADLALRLGAELAGVFVEDVDLINLAGLPFARELGLRSAARQLDLATVEQELQLQAAAARRALIAVAERRHLQWSFRVRRGQPAAEFLAAAADAEFVALSVRSRAELRIGLAGDATQVVVESASATLLCDRAVTTDPARPILLLYDGSPTARQALELAVRLARQGEGLTIVACADDADALAGLQRDLRDRLRSEDIAFRIRELRDGDRNQLIAVLRRERACLVVMPVDGGLLGGLAPAELLERLGLPVLQVRARAGAAA